MKKCSSEMHQFELADPVYYYYFKNESDLMIFGQHLENSDHSVSERRTKPNGPTVGNTARVFRLQDVLLNQSEFRCSLVNTKPKFISKKKIRENPSVKKVRFFYPLY